MGNKGDVIRIKKMDVVSSFDDKMWYINACSANFIIDIT